MIITIILFILSILLESIIPNLFKSILPLFCISIIINSNKYIKDKAYYIMLFIFGILYSILYTSSIFLYSLVYLVIGFLCKKIINKNHFILKEILVYLLLSISYIIIILLYTSTYYGDDLIDALFLFLNSIKINILYYLLVYIVYFVRFCLFSNRYKKHSY